MSPDRGEAVRVSNSVQALYLALVPGAFFINLRFGGIPLLAVAAGPSLLYMCLLVSRNPQAAIPMLRFAVAIGLLVAGTTIATIAGHGSEAAALSVPAGRNMLFYTFPAILLAPRPSARSITVVAWVGLGAMVGFLVGPGVGSFANALWRSVTNADVTVLNFYAFRRAAEFWNTTLGQMAFPNPGSIKNLIAELATTLLFLVLAIVDRRDRSRSLLLWSLGLLIVLTQSRAAWAAVVITFGLWFLAGLVSIRIPRQPFKQALAALSVAGLIVVVGPLALARLQDEGTASYDIRPELAAHYWDEFVAHPLTGSSNLHQTGLPAHIIAIDWSARAGFLGLLAALTLHGASFALVWKARPRSSKRKRSSAISLAGRDTSQIGLFGLAVLPCVRLFTTGGGALSAVASTCLGLAIVSRTWPRGTEGSRDRVSKQQYLAIHANR